MTNQDSIPNIDIKSFQDKGFLLAKNFFSKTQIRKWLALARAALKCEKRHTPDDPYHAVFVPIHQLSRKYSAFDSLVTSPALGGMAAGILHGEVRVLLDQLICKWAGARETIPHQDSPFLPLGNQPTVNCWIPLSDVDAVNGALTYYEGSHQLGILPLVHLDGESAQLRPEDYGYSGTLLLMKAGDCVFHDGAMIHGASANLSGADRFAISLQYMREGAIAHEPLHPFMREYGIRTGMSLTQDCFPRPWAKAGSRLPV